MSTRVLEGGENLRRALASISMGIRRGGSLKVGFLKGSTYPDGTPVAMVAAVHNYGAPSRGIPPRPHGSNMVARYSPEWPDEIRAQLKATNYDARLTMNRMGALIRGQWQQSIRDGPFVPLKPATIRAKGFDQPLIDKAHMINSVAFEYEER
jgi:hypothetical protein